MNEFDWPMTSATTGTWCWPCLQHSTSSDVTCFCSTLPSTDRTETCFGL